MQMIDQICMSECHEDKGGNYELIEFEGDRWCSRI